MAGNTREEILKRFAEAAWRQGSGSTQADDVMGTAQGGPGTEARDSDPVREEAADPRTENAVGSAPVWNGADAEPAGQNVQGGAKTETQGGGGASTAETVLKDVFEGGFGLVPLIGGLMGLFGGGSDNPSPLVKYQMPSSISFMSGDSGDELTAADYNEMGLPRVYDAAYTGAAPASGGVMGTPPLGPAGPNGGAAGFGASGMGGAETGANGTVATPQITVNVQAMDAQSFLDRSSDIAQAVRSAMLNMSSINDVVSEL